MVRYYTPTSAQFMSVDPMLGTTHQPYAFANGDPLNESDPLGLKGWYCVKTYKTTPGYSSHYFQGTKYGPANGKCGTFLSWLSYQTQTTINYYEFIAGLGNPSQGPTLLGGGLTPPVAPSAPPATEPSASGILGSIAHAVSSAADAVGQVGGSAANEFSNSAIAFGHTLESAFNGMNSALEKADQFANSLEQRSWINEMVESLEGSEGRLGEEANTEQEFVYVLIMIAVM